MPSTRWNEIILLLLSCPAIEARPGELVIMVQEQGLLLTAHTTLSVKIAIQNVPFYFVVRVLFLSETWKLWQQTHFVLLETFTSRYIFRLYLPVLLSVWLNAIPGKMYFWASMKSMTCLLQSWGGSEISVSRLLTCQHVYILSDAKMPYASSFFLILGYMIFLVDINLLPLKTKNKT